MDLRGEISGHFFNVLPLFKMAFISSNLSLSNLTGSEPQGAFFGSFEPIQHKDFQDL